MNNVRRLLLAITCFLILSAYSDAAEPSQPMVVAHRGLLLYAPEDTLSNFRACLELRLGFEFDVQRTKDGQLVCIHDRTINRTTSGTGKVSELTLGEIREFDAGRWFDPKFAGEKVPTVEEVLTLLSEYRQHEVLVAVDLKAENTEQELVRLAEKHNVLNQLLFIGRTISEPSVRRTIRTASRQAHVATVANSSDEFRNVISDPDSDWVYVHYVPSKEEIDAAQRSGRRVFIAGPTVSGNVPVHWQRAADVGIDAILTDYSLDLWTILRQTASKK
jgi:glycerophosphoryl diester phosphodiesterase